MSEPIIYDKILGKLREGTDIAQEAIATYPQSLTDAQKLQAQANLNDTAANALTGKLGYKVLQPGASFASQVTESNTIYEIRDVFDLGTVDAQNPVSVTIPDGCVLKFNGGLIKNGRLTNAYIEASRVKIFTGDVTFSNLKNGILYPEWWGAVADNTTDCSSAVQIALNLSKTVSFTRGNYVCNTALQCSIGASIIGESKYASIIKTNGITLHRYSKVSNVTIRAINKQTPYVLKVTNSGFGRNEYTANISITNIKIIGGAFEDTVDNQVKGLVIECDITTDTQGMYNALFENILFDGKMDYGIYFNSINNVSNDFSWITYFYFNDIFINGAKNPIEFMSDSEWNQYNFQALYFTNVTAQYNTGYTESFVRLTHISSSVFDKCHCVDKPSSFKDYHIKSEYCKVKIDSYPSTFDNMLSSYLGGASVQQMLASFTYSTNSDSTGMNVPCKISSSTKIANGNAPSIPFIIPMCYLDTEISPQSFVGVRITNYNQQSNTRKDALIGFDGSGIPRYDYGELDGEKWNLKRIYSTHTVPVHSASSFPVNANFDRGAFVFYISIRGNISYDSYTGGWYDQLGVRITSNVTKRRGNTADRTGMTMYSYNDGFLFYDTDLGKYVCWDGSAWVNLDETVVSVSASTLTQEMKDNYIYNASELTALTITLPQSVGPDFISQVNFTSGSTPTTLTAPSGIDWTGDDIGSNGQFAPKENRRYVVMLYSDGVAVRGVVQAADVAVTSQSEEAPNE